MIVPYHSLIMHAALPNSLQVTGSPEMASGQCPPLSQATGRRSAVIRPPAFHIPLQVRSSRTTHAVRLWYDKLAIERLCYQGR